MGGDTEGIRKELELIDIYRMEIAWRVQKNWAFPESLAGSKKDLVVELAFTVLPNGEIRDVWFDKRSGNQYLDDSAKRAVLKANPKSRFLLDASVKMPICLVEQQKYAQAEKAFVTAEAKIKQAQLAEKCAEEVAFVCGNKAIKSMLQITEKFF